MKNQNLILMLLIFFLGCIEDHDFTTEDEIPKLVIEGRITTEQGPYTVKITRSRDFSTADGTGFVPERNALVQISDDTGFTETLTKSGEGLDLVYTTAPGGIQGEVGRTYTLTVTIDETTYQSTPQTIERVNRFFDMRAVYHEDGVPGIGDYFDILVDVEDRSDIQQYLRWDWVSTYEFHSEPERICEILCCRDDPGEDIDHNCNAVPPDCCVECWPEIPSDGITILDTSTIEGISDYSVTKIDVNNFTFYIKYHIKVSQYSISEDAFEFYNLVKKQIENTGSVFDSAPTSISGNVFRTSNSGEAALGIFSASDVESKELFIKRIEIPRPMERPEWLDDCRKIKNSTAVKPDFWNG